MARSSSAPASKVHRWALLCALAVLTAAGPASSLAAQTAATDVSIVKSGTRGAESRDTLRYTLRVSNNSTTAAANVFVADTLPQGSRFLSASGGGVATGGVVRWPVVATFAAGAPDLVYTLEVLGPGFGNLAPVRIFNVATVETSTPDSVPANNVSRFQTVIESLASNLAIVKSGPDSVGGGDSLSYTLTVTNTGPGMAFGIVVTDTLPALGTVLSISGGGTESNGVITWPTVPLLAPGALPLSYTVSYLASAAPSVLHNVAAVRAASFDSNPLDDVSSVDTRVLDPPPSTLADLEILKSAVDSVGGSDLFTYTLRVRNLGPNTAVNVVVSDSLPSTGSVVAVSGGATVFGREIVWPTVASLAAGAAPLVYTVTYQAPAAPETLTNVARVTSTTSDPTPGNNRSSVQTRVIDPTASPVTLAIRKIGPDSVVVGSTATYTITVSNLGPGTATQVVVHDTLPPSGGAVFVSASGGATPSPSNPRLLVWPVIPTLAAGADAVFTVTLRLFASRNVDVAVARSAETGPVADSAVTFVKPVDFDSYDLQIVKDGPLTAQVGDTLAYTIRVTNLGPDPATGTVLSDTLPAGFQFVSASHQGSASLNGRVVTWPARNLAVGQDLSDTVRVIATGVGTFTNVARVSSPSDINNANDRDDATTIVTDHLDVAIDKSHIGKFVVGSTGTFRITVTNLSSTATRGPISVVDTLPLGLTYRSGQGSGWTINSPDNRAIQAFYPATLAAGASTSFDLTVLIDAAAVPRVINGAWVNTLGDSDPDNNMDADTVAIGAVDIELTKDTVGAFPVGSSGRFRFTVRNIGSDTTSAPIALVDTLPAGLTYVSFAGTGWAVSVAGQVVTGIFSQALAPGASTTFTIDVAIDGRARPCFTNSATISTVGDYPNGPTGANNTDTASACPPGDLFLRKVALPTIADIGDQVDYTLIVGVLGPGAVSNVAVSDRLPLGFRYVPGTTRFDGRTAPDPTGSPGPLLTFSVGDIPGGDSVRIAYRVQVGPGAELGDGINRARADSPDITDPPQDSARVDVRRGVFSDEGIILGKVFVDCVCDLEQGEGDPGIPGVRVYLHDGSSVVTDSEGKYSFYGLRPTSWIVKIDRSTLPVDARLLPLTNRHGNDGSSAFVDLKRGELHRADFAADSTSPRMLRQLADRRARAANDGLLLLPDESAAIGGTGSDSTASAPEFRPLLPDRMLTDRNAGLPSAPGVLEVPQGGGLRPAAAQPRSRPQSEEIAVRIEGHYRADGVTPVPVTLSLPSGQPGTVTLEASQSYWMERAVGGGADTLAVVSDLDGVAPGLQVPVAAGGSTYYLIAPSTPSAIEVRVSLDQERTRSEVIGFAPVLRPLLAIGLLEARLDIRSLTDAELGLGRDRFEDALRSFQIDSEDGDFMAAARTALFLKGGVDLDRDQVVETELTLRIDSEEDERARLFRDIQPDQFYPVYGDAGLRQFDAQSKGRVFGQLARGSSFLRYGDFNTGLGDYGQSGARALGQYTRTLNGALEHYESDRASVDAFVSRDRFRQIVDEFPGQGISGPYALSRAEGLVGSERVELVTRDRNQPAVVLHSEILERFTDYTIEPFSGRIIFKKPIANSDSEFNPVYIRVSYEVETGGDEFWVFGANGQFRPLDRFEIGGGFVRDDNPVSRFDLASVNATIELLEGTTYLVGEFARTDSASVGGGEAGRLEIRHSSERFDGRLFYLGTDRAFNNPSSALTRGREELGFRGVARIADRTQLFGELLRTENRFTQGRRTGGRVAIDQALGRWVRAQVGYRFAEETVTPATATSGATPDAVNALGARLTAGLPFLPEGSIFGEFEQDVADRDQRRALIGGDYRIFDRARLYGRHEFISSLTGPYGLNPELERNTTIFGISADYLAGQSIFSEYRARDAFAGRDAQAAIGLRNNWGIDEGVRLSASLERLSPLAGDAGNATALTGALEFTQSPLWKASVRAEYYARDGSDNVFGSVGYARKLSSDWTFLGNTVFSTLLDGDRAFERTRLGLAYRQTERNRWNALGRYEHRYDESPADGASTSSIRSAHIFSTHLNYQPDPDLIFRAQWASKFASLNSDGLSTSERAHLLGGRATLDVTHALDIGVIGRALFASGSAATQFGVGAELGVLLTDNLRLAGGYNVFGFRDTELSVEEYTDRGFYVQLGFKFDESLFGGSEPFRGIPDSVSCGCGSPPADLVVDISDGPAVVDREAVVDYTIATTNAGPGTADTVSVSVVLPDHLEVIEASEAYRLGGGRITWSFPGSLNAGDTVLHRLSVRARCSAPDQMFTLLAQGRTTTAEADIANNDDPTASRLGPPPCLNLIVEVVGPDTVGPGATFEHTVAVRNERDRPAQNVVDSIVVSNPFGSDSVLVHRVAGVPPIDIHTVTYTVPVCGAGGQRSITTSASARTDSRESTLDDNRDRWTTHVRLPPCGPVDPPIDPPVDPPIDPPVDPPVNPPVGESRLNLRVTGPLLRSGEAAQFNRALLFQVVTTNTIVRGAGQTLIVDLVGSIDTLPDGLSTPDPAFAFGNRARGRLPADTAGLIVWPTLSLAPARSVTDTIAVTVRAPTCVAGPESVRMRVPVAVRAVLGTLSGRAGTTVDAVLDPCGSPPTNVSPDTTDVFVDIGFDGLGGARSRTVGAGDTVRLTLSSGNLSSVDARNVELSVLRPGDGWLFVVPDSVRPPWMSASITNTSGAPDTVVWSPRIGFPALVRRNDAVVFVAPDLPIGAQPLDYWLTARVRTTDRDADPTNNQDSVRVSVVRGRGAPDLWVWMDTLSVEGCDVTFRVVAKNIGFATADSVRLTVPVPVGAELFGGQRARRDRGVRIWRREVAALAPGDSLVDTLFVRFAEGSHTDTVEAVVSTATPEPNLLNNQDMTVVIVQDTITLESCCGTACTLCVWPWPWWVLLLPLFALLSWMLYRRRRYGAIFVPCFRLFTIFRRKEIRGFVSELRSSPNKAFGSVRQIHDRIGGQPCTDWELTEELLYSYRDVQAWPQVYRLYETCPPALRKKAKIRRLYAFALNRDGRGEDSEFVLRTLVSEMGGDPHTLGILGRVYKDRWELAYQCARAGDCSDDGEDRAAGSRADKLLDLAIATYREGHEAGPENPYPGLNALTLSHFLPEAPSWYKALKEDVEAAAEKWAPEFEYWLHATRAELAVLDKDATAAQRHMDKAVEKSAVVWELTTTLRNLNLIRTAWQDRDGAVPEFLGKLIESLAEEVAREGDGAEGTSPPKGNGTKDAVQK